MIARVAGASLGLLAFTVTILSGLWIHNPVTVTLSRSIFALFVFFLIGMVLGSVAQIVVAEHEKKRQAVILDEYRRKGEEIERAVSGRAQPKEGEQPSDESAATEAA